MITMLKRIQIKWIIVIMLSLTMLVVVIPMFIGHGGATTGDRWDLENFIYNIEIYRDNGSIIQNNDTVLVGDQLKVVMKFHEVSETQMAPIDNPDGSLSYQLIYQLPDSFQVIEVIHNAPILVEVYEKVSGVTVKHNIEVGDYSIDENGYITLSFKKIKVDQYPTYYTVRTEDVDYYFMEYTDMELAILANVSVSAAEGQVEINFGNEVKRTVDVKVPEEEKPAAVKVYKFASYDVKSETMKYTIRIDAITDIKNVVLHDLTILQEANQILSQTKDGLYPSLYSGLIWYSNDVDWVYTSTNPCVLEVMPWDVTSPYADFSILNRSAGSGDSWQLTFDNPSGDNILHANNSIFIEYSIDMTDFYNDQPWASNSLYRWNGYFNTIENDALVYALDIDDKPVPPASAKVCNALDKTQIKKEVKNVYFNANNERSIDWTIRYGISGENGYFDPNGAIITDILDDNMFVREGTTAKVYLYCHNIGQVEFTFVVGENGTTLYTSNHAYNNLAIDMFRFNEDGFTLNVPNVTNPRVYYVYVELLNVGIRDINEYTNLHNQVSIQDGDTKVYDAYYGVGPETYQEKVTTPVPVTKTGIIAGDSLKYEISFDVSSNYQGRSFYVQDWMFLATDSDDTTAKLSALSAQVVNPKDLSNVQLFLDGVKQSQDVYDFSQQSVITGSNPLDYQIEAMGNHLELRFGGANQSLNSKWPLGSISGSEVTYNIKITYELQSDTIITYGTNNQVKLSDYLSRQSINSVNNEVTVFHDGATSKDREILSSSYLYKEGKIDDSITSSTYIDYIVHVPANIPFTTKEGLDTSASPNLGAQTVFVDQFDERMEYVPKSLYIRYIDMNGNVFYYAPVETTQSGVSTLLSDSSVNEVGVNVTTSGKITVRFTNLNRIELNGTISDATILNNLSSQEKENLKNLTNFEVLYRLRIKDAAETNSNGRFILDNKATIISGAYQFSDDYQIDFLPKDRLSKSLLGIDNNIATYKVQINPDKKTLNKSGGPVLLSDRMVESLLFYTSSFCLMEEKNGVMVEVELKRVSGVPTEAYEYSINSTHTSNDTLMLLVPDATHLEFIYDARVIGPAGSTVTLINYASLGDIQRKTTINQYQIQSSMANASASQVEFELLKHDRDFSSEVLKGAKFALYTNAPYDGYQNVYPPQNLNSGTEEGSQVEYVVDRTFTINNDETNEGTTFYYIDCFVTGEDGIARINSKWLTPKHNMIYALVEYEAPSGYVQPNADNKSEFISLFSLNPLTDQQKITLIDYASQTQVVTDFIMIPNHKPIEKQVQIIKADSEILELKLAGARFAFYTDEPNTKPVDIPDIDRNLIKETFTLGNRTFYYTGETTTDSNGIGTIPTTINPEDKAIYALVEVATPDNYKSSSDPYKNPILMCFDPKMQTSSTDVSRTSVLGKIPTGYRNTYEGTVGYSFIPSTDIVVDQVGRPDNAENGGTKQNHTISIWENVGTNSGILLATTKVGPSSKIVDTYRVASLNNMIILEAGKSYTIASEEYEGGDCWHDAGQVGGALPVRDNLINVLSGRYSAENVHSFPQSYHGMPDHGYVGVTIFENKTTNRVVDINLLDGILINDKPVDPNSVYNFTLDGSDGAYAYYTVTNHYDYKEMTGTLTASKVVLGKPAFDTTFTFVLKELNSADISDVKANGIKICKSVTIESGQTEAEFSFTNNGVINELPLMRLGTHYFSLSETVGPEGEWTFDKSKRLVEVEVKDTDQGRVFTCKFVEESPNKTYTASQFVNTYNGNNKWQDFAFPETGSIYGRVPVILGCSLAGIAFIGLVVYKKKQDV